MITVVDPGMLTTVQDNGRFGFQQFGVPVGGVMDVTAARIANILVGNTDSLAVLEVTLGGLTLHVEHETLIAVTGAELQLSVDHCEMACWRPVRVPAGSLVRLKRPLSGLRTYLAVSGGFDVPVVLNGRGTSLRAAFGGHHGRSLRRGDQLPMGHPSSLSVSLLHRFRRDSGDCPTSFKWFAAEAFRRRWRGDTARALKGPEYDRFTPQAGHEFFKHPYRVTSQVDRMGCRLEGHELMLKLPMELLSTGVMAGTVQVPPGGQPIVLMSDAQTTGGYPRIGQVIQADLPVIAQLRPGQEVLFCHVTEDEARDAFLQQEAALRTLRAAIIARF